MWRWADGPGPFRYVISRCGRFLRRLFATRSFRIPRIYVSNSCVEVTNGCGFGNQRRAVFEAEVKRTIGIRAITSGTAFHFWFGLILRLSHEDCVARVVYIISLGLDYPSRDAQCCSLIWPICLISAVAYPVISDWFKRETVLPRSLARNLPDYSHGEFSAGKLHPYPSWIFVATADHYMESHVRLKR